MRRTLPLALLVLAAMLGRKAFVARIRSMCATCLAHVAAARGARSPTSA